MGFEANDNAVWTDFDDEGPLGADSFPAWREMFENPVRILISSSIASLHSSAYLLLIASV